MAAVTLVHLVPESVGHKEDLRDVACSEELADVVRGVLKVPGSRLEITQGTWTETR